MTQIVPLIEIDDVVIRDLPKWRDRPMRVVKIEGKAARTMRDDFPPKILAEGGWLIPIEELRLYSPPLASALPYDEPPQAGDIVVFVGRTYVDWLIEYDKCHRPDFKYCYNTFKRRADKLDMWLWSHATVIKVNGSEVTVQDSQLGTQTFPVECTAVLRRPGGLKA